METDSLKSGRIRNRNSRRSNLVFDESAGKNMLSWRVYRDKLCELAVSMFEWKNLPPEIDPIFMERVLFFNGKILFFKEQELNQYVVMSFSGAGQFDIYNNPLKRRAYASNGYQNYLDETNSVIIYNNVIRQPSIDLMIHYAHKLEEIDRTIDVNIRAQKTPIMILCDEKQRLSLQNLYMKYDGNSPVIYGDKGMNPNPIRAITTGAPYLGDKLYDLKSRTWNEALTFLGISNVNNVKRERLITDEVTRGEGGTIANRYSRLTARRNACKQINDMFGLNIWCDFREDYQTIESDATDTFAREPDTDGQDGSVEDIEGVSNE